MPTSSSRLSAKIERIITLTMRSEMYGLSVGPTTASTKAHSRGMKYEMRCMSDLASHETFGSPDENYRHQHIDAHAAQLCKEHLAKGVDEAHQQRRDER